MTGWGGRRPGDRRPVPTSRGPANSFPITGAPGLLALRRTDVHSMAAPRRPEVPSYASPYRIGTKEFHRPVRSHYDGVCGRPLRCPLRLHLQGPWLWRLRAVQRCQSSFSVFVGVDVSWSQSLRLY